VGDGARTCEHGEAGWVQEQLFGDGSLEGVTGYYDPMEALPSPAAGLLQLARHRSGLSQRELAERAGVPKTMVSAYERGKHQPTLPTLERLLRAAGWELRLQLVPYDPQSDSVQARMDSWSPAQREAYDRWLDETAAAASGT
jgi:transcriptional regulator with XRE-family HTH domain